MAKILYEILVPTIYGDTRKPIRKKHHQQWDNFVQKITNGLTILKPAKGRWIHDGQEYPERVIPVRIMCFEPFIADRFNKSQINKIIQFTLSHYRQKAVMYYVLSNNVNIVYAPLQNAMQKNSETPLTASKTNPIITNS